MSHDISSIASRARAQCPDVSTAIGRPILFKDRVVEAVHAQVGIGDSAWFVDRTVLGIT